MICIPLGADSNQALLALLERAAGEPAQAHELRLDLLREPPRVEELVAASTRPVIATCRSREEGGAFAGPPEERRAILLRAARAGAAYLDAEAADLPYLAERGDSILIASYHNFQDTPRPLDAKVRELAALPCDWVKFAVTVNTPADNIAVLESISQCPKPCIGLGMGERGAMTRILGPAFGSRMTFGSLDVGMETAPGQPTARDLHTYYRVNSLTRDTAVYGLLGNPVRQSKGYITHNVGFAKLGMDAVYIPFLSTDAEGFLDLMPKALNLCGLSVTIPYKRVALAWAPHASEACRQIGVANTLTKKKDGWRANNTDCMAVFESIKAHADAAGMNLFGAEALVMGAGGAARAAGMALLLLGCRVTVTARSDLKAEEVAGEMDWQTCPWESRVQSSWRVIANATPVGMIPNTEGTPYPADGFREDMLVFDVVHNPPETRLIREAALAGAVTVTGGEMFNRQASGQFRLWTGKDLPA